MDDENTAHDIVMLDFAKASDEWSARLAHCQDFVYKLQLLHLFVVWHTIVNTVQ